MWAGHFIGANVGVKFLVAFANGNSAYTVGLGFGVDFRAGCAFRKGFYLFGEIGIGSASVVYYNYNGYSSSDTATAMALSFHVGYNFGTLLKK